MDAQKAAGEACSDPILTDASVKTETKATSSEADIEKKLEKATSELEKAEAKLKDAQNALDKANAVLDKANAELKAAKTESEIKRANQAVDRANDGVDTAQMLVKACTARVVELTQNLTNLEKVQTGAKPSMSLDTFPRDLADALPDVDVGKGDYKRVKDGIDSTLQEFRERKQEAKTTSSGLSKKDAKLSSLGTFSVPSNFFLSLPKGLTDVRLKHPFVVRNDMLARLNLILQWQEEKWPTNGFTLHGPKGTGKSSMLVFLSLALFSLGWGVVYIPSCARWLEKASEALQAEHFLKHAEVGLRQHRKRQIRAATSGVPAGAKSWGDLLSARDTAARPAMLALLQELHEVADLPVVFLFDDVGSVWKEGKQRDAMFRLGAGFGEKVKNGIKVFASSGNSEFLKREHAENLRPGMAHGVTPMSEDEFAEFLRLELSTRPEKPWASFVATAKCLEEFYSAVTSVSARVPRELVFLFEQLDLIDVKVSDEKLLFTVLDKATHSYLHGAQTGAISRFVSDHEEYTRAATPEARARHDSALLSMLLDEEPDSKLFDHNCLDFSLVYAQPAGGYRFLTPTARDVVMDHLLSLPSDRFERLDSLATWLRVLRDPTLPVDTKGRPFENLLRFFLLANARREVQLQTYALDGSASQTATLRVRTTGRFDQLCPPLQARGKPAVEPLCLLMPNSESYPDVDLILTGDGTADAKTPTYLLSCKGSQKPDAPSSKVFGTADKGYNQLKVQRVEYKEGKTLAECKTNLASVWHAAVSGQDVAISVSGTVVTPAHLVRVLIVSPRWRKDIDWYKAADAKGKPYFSILPLDSLVSCGIIPTAIANSFKF